MKTVITESELIAACERSDAGVPEPENTALRDLKTVSARWTQDGETLILRIAGVPTTMMMPRVMVRELSAEIARAALEYAMRSPNCETQHQEAVGLQGNAILVGPMVSTDETQRWHKTNQGSGQVGERGNARSEETI
jgi:hypothetical protein